MKKFLLFILIIAVIVLGLAVVNRNLIVKNVLERGVARLTGQKLTVAGVAVGLKKSDVHVKELKIYNPKGYENMLLLEVPEIYIHYAPKDIIKGKIHLPQLRVNISQVNVEKDKNGVLNVDHFKIVQPDKDKAPAEKSGKTDFLVDHLDFTLGTISYKDESLLVPLNKTFNVNVSKSFRNVDSAAIIASAIIAEVVKILVAEGINLAAATIAKYAAIDDLLEEGETEKYKEKAQELKERGREKAEELKEEGKEKVEELKETG